MKFFVWSVRSVGRSISVCRTNGLNYALDKGQSNDSFDGEGIDCGPGLKEGSSPFLHICSGFVGLNKTRIETYLRIITAVSSSSGC